MNSWLRALLFGLLLLQAQTGFAQLTYVRKHPAQSEAPRHSRWHGGAESGTVAPSPAITPGAPMGLPAYSAA